MFYGQSKDLAAANHYMSSFEGKAKLIVGRFHAHSVVGWMNLAELYATQWIMIAIDKLWRCVHSAGYDG